MAITDFERELIDIACQASPLIAATVELYRDNEEELRKLAKSVAQDMIDDLSRPISFQHFKGLTPAPRNPS